jgi:peptidyl-prolyl cis-trans isomerase SurA
MMNKKLVLLVVLALCLAMGVSEAKAATIAAVVKDKVITEQDVKEKANLIYMYSKMPRNEKSAPLVRYRALQMLIEENLIIIEGKKFEIELEDAAVNDTLQKFAKSHGITLSALPAYLKGKGTSLEVVKREMIANYMLSAIAYNVVKPKIVVTDREIAEQLEFLRRAAKDSITTNDNKVKLAEIVIYSSEDPKKAEALAKEVLSQLKQGKDFKVLAKTFSQSMTAKDGGEIADWLYVNQLSPELAAEVANLPKGQVSRIISKNDGALQIVKLLDIKNATSKARQAPLALPTEDQVRSALLDHKLHNQMNNFLRKTKQRTYISIPAETK